jgi:hypothetical protein
VLPNILFTRFGLPRRTTVRYHFFLKTKYKSSLNVTKLKEVQPVTCHEGSEMELELQLYRDVTAYNDTEQVWYKGFSDVSIVWQRRRNGP